MIRTALVRGLHGRRLRRLLAEAEADLARLPLPDAVAARATPPAPGRPRLGTLRRLHAVAGAILREAGETAPCLVRALALLGEARRLGFPADLVVGVRRDDPAAPAGHAWLAVGGKPLLESEDELAPYRAVATLPLEAPARAGTAAT